jgi:hypothetical protein
MRALPVLWLLAVSLASAAAEAPPVSESLRPLIRSLSRPVYTWHCLPRARLGLPAEGYVAPEDPVLLPFLRGKVERFWDLSLPVRPSAAASGLFSGIDPVSCRAFAGVGDGWVIAQVILPEGFRFLDVRSGEGGTPKLAAEVRARLAAEGCDVASTAALIVMQESDACRRIAVRALRELDVDGILWSYPRTSFDTCGERPDGVFILLDPETIQSGRVRLFTKDSRPGDGGMDDRLRIRDLHARARQSGSMRDVPWPELEGTPPPDRMEDWMRQHLFGCGEHGEDRIRSVSLEIH